MRLKLQALILAILFITLINLCTAHQQNRRLQKRMNFNFLRTWQPSFHRAEPIRENYARMDNNEIDDSSEDSPDNIIRTPEQRIKSRLLCMNALANPSACANI